MATQTPNYHFPKYEANDLPNLLDEHNEFADLADTAINNVMMTATNAGTAAQNAKTAADAASAKADGVEETVGTLSVQVVTAQNTAEQGLSLAQGNKSDIAGIDEQLETVNQSISSLQSGKAPTNHASATSTYGAASTTNYGHVRLSDTPSSSGVASSTAATPAAVQSVLAQAGATRVASGSFPTSGGIVSGITGNNSIQVIAVPLIKLLVVSVHIDGMTLSGGGEGTLDAGAIVPEQYRPTNAIRCTGNAYSLVGGSYVSAIEVTTEGNVRLIVSSSGTPGGAVGCDVNMLYLFGLDLPSLEA